MSSILGVGGGAGIIAGALIIEHLDWHWLFVLPTIFTAVAAVCTWRFIPESPIRDPGRVNWLAAALMSIGISAGLIAVAQTTTWGWISAKTLGLFAIGALFCVAWIYVETHSEVPLIDMKMMRIRGVWTTNVAAFLLGAGMYSSFIILPQFAQLPTSTGFGFGASVVDLGAVPAAGGARHGPAGHGRGPGRAPLRLQGGARRGHLDHRAWRSRSCWSRTATRIELLISATLLGIGVGLAFSALGNLIVMAVPAGQTGRRQRHEHGDAHTRRCTRRSAVGDLHRQQRVQRPADRDRLQPVVRDGDRVSDRGRVRQPAGALAPRRAGRERARGAGGTGGRERLSQACWARPTWSATFLG